MRADRLLQNNGYDFVLLDVGLPELGGYGWCAASASAASACPVIVITARDALDDRIYGLDLGADDYLVKPFELAGAQRAHARGAAAQRGGAGRGWPSGRWSSISTAALAELDGAPMTLSGREWEVLRRWCAPTGAR